MIAVVDYGMGNLRSLCNAVGRLGAEVTVTSDPAVIASADKILLPGVGNAGEAMHNLRELSLDSLIPSLRVPVLGICIGMQLMCSHSEEADTPCLDIFDTKVVKFIPSENAKVPHMGWNAVSNMSGKLFKGIAEGTFFYFVHSYYPQLCCDTVATSRHELLFSAALKYENFYGTQFHPEKSGEAGERLLANFLAL